MHSTIKGTPVTEPNVTRKLPRTFHPPYASRVSLGSLKLFATLLALTFLISTPEAAAQAPLQIPGLETLVLEVSPEYPAPGQRITATISSTVINLDQSTISWTLNGSSAVPAQERKRLSFTAGEVGSTATVRVTVRTNDGQLLTEQRTLRPAALDLLWQATSYTPPFYRGKGLPASGSDLTVTALPDIRTASGRRLSADELIFTWKQNGRILGAFSGRGKDTVTLPGPEIYKNFDIIVDAISLDQSVGASARLTLRPATPRVLFYESHPTLGVRFEEALGDTFEIPGGEVMVSAQPYFFETRSPSERAVQYRWNLNGSEVKNPSSDQSLIVLRPTGAGGEARVSLSAKHLTSLFQKAQRAFTVSFTGDLTL